MRDKGFAAAGWTVADQAVVSGSNFLTIYLLARFMPIAEFGLYMAAWISLLFLVSLESALFTEPHNILGPKVDEAAYRRLTGVLAAALHAASFTVALLLVGIGLILGALDALGPSKLLVMLGLVVVPWTAQEFVRRALYTRSETRTACINDAVSYGLQVAGIALLVWLTPSPPLSAALGIVGTSSLVAALLGAWQIRNHFALPVAMTDDAWRTWREAFAFGKWLLARNLVSSCGEYGHGWLLLAMLGPAALGTYKAAEHLLNMINPLRLAAFSYLAPRGSRIYAQGGSPALRAWIGGVYRSVGLVFTGGILLLMIFARPLLDLAYGDKFGQVSLEWILVLGGVAAVLTFSRVPLEMGIAAMKHSRPLFWVHVWSVPLLLVFGTSLIHVFGIFGVPVSSIVTGSVLLVLAHRAFIRVSAAEAAAVSASTATSPASGGVQHEVVACPAADTVAIAGSRR